MPAERAGYTVTMFLVDLSPSMGASRTMELPCGPGCETKSVEMTKLERCLQFVKMKIQEMIFNGRKTDQCGVITFGSEETNNVVNQKNGGYEHVSEHIPIGQPNSDTLAQLDELQASETAGDPIDALIVGLETQNTYLENKRTWTRKVVLVTDGESPMEVEQWEAIVKRMMDWKVALTIVGADFDDEEFGYQEKDKSTMKRINETFYHRFMSSLPENLGLIGTLECALLTLSFPNIKEVKSALMKTVLRIGDVEVRGNEAIELNVRVAKGTSLSRAASWKKFFEKVGDDDDMDVEDEDKTIYKEAKRRTEYFIDRSAREDEKKEAAVGDASMDIDEEKSVVEEGHIEKVEKEQLVKGFKYGSTYVPCPDAQFQRLSTKKGIEICGFFHEKNLNRSHHMGEISYVYASEAAPEQLAFSSIVQAMAKKRILAIARMVNRDGLDPKMGVLSPVNWGSVGMFLWVQMPFADDVRRYTFPSLSTLISRSGEKIMKHSYLPTEGQLEAMGNFVDAMDLMKEGEENEKGEIQSWFETRLSYNPVVHRTKQAQFHAAVVSDITTHPLAPPHPELTKYFNTPKRVIKNARDALEECKSVFNVKEVPKSVPKARKDGHAHAQDQDEDMILLDQIGPARKRPVVASPAKSGVSNSSMTRTAAKKALTDDSETESESEEELLLEQKSKQAPVLPTPTASPEPEQSDPQCAPGRIIGNAYPLKDFRRNLEQGDVVTKAVEDLGTVVREIVQRPFASRRQDEMIECLEVLRETCLREDEIDAWNAILKGLKQDCMREHGNMDLWAALQTAGHRMSLISSTEAKTVGAKSDISESDAAAFMRA